METQLAEPKRYIVLAGSVPIVEQWRIERGLQRRDVIAVTPGIALRALCGLRGDFEVITHITWCPSPEVAAMVAHRLRRISPAPG
jgi:hypothetical protein